MFKDIPIFLLKVKVQCSKFTLDAQIFVAENVDKLHRAESVRHGRE